MSGTKYIPPGGGSGGGLSEGRIIFFLPALSGATETPLLENFYPGISLLAGVATNQRFNFFVPDLADLSEDPTIRWRGNSQNVDTGNYAFQISGLYRAVGELITGSADDVVFGEFVAPSADDEIALYSTTLDASLMAIGDNIAIEVERLGNVANDTRSGAFHLHSVELDFKSQ